MRLPYITLAEGLRRVEAAWLAGRLNEKQFVDNLAALKRGYCYQPAAPAAAAGDAETEQP